jgi:hypothetical protein
MDEKIEAGHWLRNLVTSGRRRTGAGAATGLFSTKATGGRALVSMVGSTTVTATLEMATKAGVGIMTGFSTTAQ